ncbi:metal-sensitive transcriptional regulator [Candidatus Microgenomates bacterium]|nr:metal-sensitive transcriptional regulator [Candidatus Microgenomates bacterium]
MSIPPGGIRRRSMESKKQALQRIKIAQGHLAKVRQMLEKEEYCPDIIHQSQAVQAALKKIDEIILEGHLQNCVLSDVKNKKKLTEEILEVFRKKQ